MNLDARKYNFIQELTTVDDLLLKKLELVLKANKNDWFDDLSLEEKQEIEKGLNEADNDQLTPHKQVMSQFYKWH